jgi:hypothetical protein
MAPDTSDERPTIYSIGYEALEPDELVRILNALSADLIDVRSKPQNNRARPDGKGRFNRSRLVDLLGRRYQWHGDSLGGMPPGVQADGIDYLIHRPRPSVLMCLEEAPGECHRHRQIAVQLLGHGIDVAHIYKDVIIRASDLQIAIDSEAEDYPYNLLEEVLSVGGYDIMAPDEPIEGPRTGRLSDYLAKNSQSEPKSDRNVAVDESSKSSDKSTISASGHRVPGQNDPE